MLMDWTDNARDCVDGAMMLIMPLYLTAPHHTYSVCIQLNE